MFRPRDLGARADGRGRSATLVFTGVPLGYAGSVGYLIGSPIVHWAHTHVGLALHARW